jgi:uncharacterized membrane protein YjfL (UPF0719 family)
MRTTRSLLWAAAILAVATGLSAGAEEIRMSLPQGGEFGAGSSSTVWGALLALLLSLVQLALGLGLAVFAINAGMKLVSALLSKGGEPINIWEQIKNKNVAVALLGAGVVISYANVIGSGIAGITASLNGLIGGGLTLKQALSGVVGGAVNLAVAIAVASLAITLVFRVMEKLTKGMSERQEFAQNNFAVGAIYCGLLIGVSQLVASGVAGVGTGVNLFLSTLFGRG